jgi:hypothetical protein
VSEDTHARFLSRAFRNLARHDIAEPKFSSLDITPDLLAILRPRAFRNDHERIEPTCRIAFFDCSRDFS